jgi:poly(hydroxyalkanoate) granule-associated protein
MVSKMDTPIEEMTAEAEETLEEKRKPLVDAVRKVLLAGVGAVTLAQDEVENLVNKLIERGEIAEQDGRRLVREWTNRNKEEVIEEEAVEVEEPTEETAEAKRNPLVEATRSVLLAGAGAVTLAQDEAEKFVNRLVERGEMAERDGRKLLDDLKDRRRCNTQKAEEELDRRVENLLNRLNVPTKVDIDALSAKINELTKKIDKLSQAGKPAKAKEDAE